VAFPLREVASQGHYCKQSGSANGFRKPIDMIATTQMNITRRKFPFLLLLTDHGKRNKDPFSFSMGKASKRNV
jgi:hypothetical protein